MRPNALSASIWRAASLAVDSTPSVNAARTLSLSLPFSVFSSSLVHLSVTAALAPAAVAKPPGALTAHARTHARTHTHMHHTRARRSQRLRTRALGRTKSPCLYPPAHPDARHTVAVLGAGPPRTRARARTHTLIDPLLASSANAAHLVSDRSTTVHCLIRRTLSSSMSCELFSSSKSELERLRDGLDAAPDTPPADLDRVRAPARGASPSSAKATASSVSSFCSCVCTSSLSCNRIGLWYVCCCWLLLLPYACCVGFGVGFPSIKYAPCLEQTR